MLGGAFRVLYLARSRDVLPSSWIRNSRGFSKAVKNGKYTKPKNVERLKKDIDNKEKIMALTKRIKLMQAMVKDLEKKNQTEKAKIVRGKLILILRDLDNALRELRQLL